MQPHSPLPGNLAVLVCTRVFEREAPVLFVSHDADGDWQFLCDGEHASDPLDGPRLVALEEVLGWDASLAPLVGLERGHWAEREALSEDWRIRTDPLGRRG